MTSIRLYVGNIGTGKTILLTLMAYLNASADVAIYSNCSFDRRIIPHTRLEKLKDLREVGDPPNAFFLDELWKTMDSRKSSNLSNMLASSDILESRKRGISVHATAQFYSSVDLRFRGLVNLGFMPKIVAWYDDKYPLVIKADYAEPMTIDQLGPVIGTQAFPLIMEGCYIPNLYDTNELIKPLAQQTSENVKALMDEYMTAPPTLKSDLKDYIAYHELMKGKKHETKEISLAAGMIIGTRKGIGKISV